MYLIVALTANLAILGYFKYAGFFLDSLEGIGSALGLDTDLPAVNVVLPIGISFYTFNSMSYTIDVYRGVCRPARNVVHYAAFVAMFPHLIAGPIVRYADIESQLARLQPRLTRRPRRLRHLLLRLRPRQEAAVRRHDRARRSTSCSRGTSRSGSSRRGARRSATRCSCTSTSPATPTWRSASRSCSASGSRRTSTRRTSRSTSPSSGGAGTCRCRSSCATTCSSRWAARAAAAPQTLRNLLIVMFLGGLWHGAAWTFVVWGLLHGVFLVVHALARGAGLTPPSVIVNRHDHLRRRGGGVRHLPRRQRSATRSTCCRAWPGCTASGSCSFGMALRAARSRRCWCSSTSRRTRGR